MAKIVRRLQEEFRGNYPGVSLEAMTIIIESLKIRAKSKGFIFNCLALSRNLRGKEDELDQFLGQLARYKHDLPDKARCQLVIEIDSHWSCIDIQLRNAQPEFFMLDAADSYIVVPTVASIHKRFPEALIRYCGGKIQVDEGNCNFFALSHAWGMAKIPDLHDQLVSAIHGETKTVPSSKIEKIIHLLKLEDSHLIDDEESIKIAYGKIENIRINDIPKSFGVLLKTIQHLRFFKAEFESKGFLRSKGKLLDPYVAKHTKDVINEIEKPLTMRNTAIQHVRNKLFRMALEYLENHQEKIKKVLEKRLMAKLNPWTEFNSPLPVPESDSQPSSSYSISS